MNRVSFALVLALSVFAVHAAEWGTVAITYQSSKLDEVSITTPFLRARMFNDVTHEGKTQFGIMDLIDAANGRSNNVMAGIIDGAPGGKVAGEARITREGDRSTAFTVKYNDGRRWTYTVYKESPVIRVEYHSWNYFKAFQDFATPGGLREGNEAKIYGSENYKRPIVDMSDGAYFERSRDGGDADALSYRGWFIMGYYNPRNNNGYARVFQFGNCSKVKLMLNFGVEAFFNTTGIVGYIYPFAKGPEQMMDIAFEIVKRHEAGQSMATLGVESTHVDVSSFPARRPSAGSPSPYTVTPLGRKLNTTALSPGLDRRTGATAIISSGKRVVVPYVR